MFVGWAKRSVPNKVKINAAGGSPAASHFFLLRQEKVTKKKATPVCRPSGMFANGLGVANDAEQAVQWYRKAAEQGYAVAQFHLGAMYANGQGVAKDEAQALKWYRKAANQGDGDAKEAVAKLSNKQNSNHQLPDENEAMRTITAGCGVYDVTQVDKKTYKRCTDKELAAYGRVQRMSKDKTIPDGVWMNCWNQNFGMWAKCIDVAKSTCSFKNDSDIQNCWIWIQSGKWMWK